MQCSSFTLIGQLGSVFRKRHRSRVRPQSSLRPILCIGTPFLEVNRKPFALESPVKCPTSRHLWASIWSRVSYPAIKQLPPRPSHRHPRNVASPTKIPIVVVAIKVHDIEPFWKGVAKVIWIWWRKVWRRIRTRKQLTKQSMGVTADISIPPISYP